MRWTVVSPPTSTRSGSPGLFGKSMIEINRGLARRTADDASRDANTRCAGYRSNIRAFSRCSGRSALHTSVRDMNKCWHRAEIRSGLMAESQPHHGCFSPPIVNLIATPPISLIAISPSSVARNAQLECGPGGGTRATGSSTATLIPLGLRAALSRQTSKGDFRASPCRGSRAFFSAKSTKAWRRQSPQDQYRILV